MGPTAEHMNMSKCVRMSKLSLLRLARWTHGFGQSVCRRVWRKEMCASRQGVDRRKCHTPVETLRCAGWDFVSPILIPLTLAPAEPVQSLQERRQTPFSALNRRGRPSVTSHHSRRQLGGGLPTLFPFPLLQKNGFFFSFLSCFLLLHTATTQLLSCPPSFLVRCTLLSFLSLCAAALAPSISEPPKRLHRLLLASSILYPPPPLPLPPLPPPPTTATTTHYYNHHHHHPPFLHPLLPQPSPPSCSSSSSGPTQPFSINRSIGQSTHQSIIPPANSVLFSCPFVSSLLALNSVFCLLSSH